MDNPWATETWDRFASETSNLNITSVSHLSDEVVPETLDDDWGATWGTAQPPDQRDQEKESVVRRSCKRTLLLIP